MTARDFCYWLQGYFEITDANPPVDGRGGFTPQQADRVRRHLAMVFAPDPPAAVEVEGATARVGAFACDIDGAGTGTVAIGGVPIPNVIAFTLRVEAGNLPRLTIEQNIGTATHG